jgi:hypothetical protein
MNCCSDFLSSFFGGFLLLFASAGFWDWVCGGELGVLVSAATAGFGATRNEAANNADMRKMALMVSSERAVWWPLATACLKISRSGLQNNNTAPLFRVVRSTRRVGSSLCRLTPLQGQGSIRMCWFPGANRGGKREHGDCTLQQSVAAPATVSGESASKLATGQPGRPDADSDPRARRPASAVTQPVDGESIRSGCSQR